MRSEFWLLAMVIEASVAVALLVWRDRVHDRERRDLLNRLMAGDYTRYRTGEEENPPGAVRNWLRDKSEKGKGAGKEPQSPTE